jgi:hypothetical protein
MQAMENAVTVRTEKQEASALAEAQYDLFCRNFRDEIRTHRRVKREAYEILNPLSERKAQLHSEMDQVRAKLDRWHRGSKSFFGNKGKKIKKDSLLGVFGLEQTVAQKEDLERQRSRISASIRHVKDEMSEIYKCSIEPAKISIKRALEDEKRMHALEKSGQGKTHFKRKVTRLKAEIVQVELEISRLEGKLQEARSSFFRTQTSSGSQAGSKD